MNDSAACRRRQILAAAERLVGHYGPGKTTVADIARAAEIGVGTIYLEFSSKDAILVALSEERYGAILRAMEEAARAPEPFDRRLLGFFDRRLEGFLALTCAGAHAVDLVHCGVCPAIQGVREDFERRQLELLSELLRGGRDAGIFACEDPTRSAEITLRAFAACAPPALFGRSPEAARADLQGLHGLVLWGLVRR